MKKLFLIFLFTLLPFNAQARIKIFACEPHWESLAREITKDKVDIFLASPAIFDAHDVKPTVDLIAKARESDMFFCSGSDLESSWFLKVTQSNSKDRALDGALGSFMAADFIHDLENKKRISSQGLNDKAALKNNPYVHLDPNNIALIAAEFTNRIKQLDPTNADFYQQSYEVFADKWQRFLSNLSPQIQSISDLKIVVTNNDFAYLTNWLGIQVVAKIYEKGEDAKFDHDHLNEVAASLKEQKANAIIYAMYQDKKPIQYLSEKSNIKTTMIPFTVYGAGYAGDLFSLFNGTLTQLVNICKNGCK